ncbi:MAG: hypothetical protein HC911_05310 [Chloroflexaceae bacterium]|nr:hypothetical protein [Chloroflexaceae bacterium]
MQRHWEGDDVVEPFTLLPFAWHGGACHLCAQADAVQVIALGIHRNREHARADGSGSSRQGGPPAHAGML